LAATLVAGSIPLVATDASAQQPDRVKELGAKIRCMCNGCNDAAGKCYHVGGNFSGPCDTAKAMLKELAERVARGDSDDLVMQSFVQEYGTGVYMEPPKQGIGRVAWLIPSVSLIAGAALVILVVRRWRERPAMVAAGHAAAPKASENWLERARRRADRETED